MVQYEGHLTKDGELMVSLDGSFVPLHEFLQNTRLAEQRQRRREGAGERRRLRVRTLAVAK